MNEHEVIADAQNNPFLSNETPYDTDRWESDDVARAKVYSYLRKRIERVKWFIDHPLDEENWNESTMNHLKRELARWVNLLNQAIYN